MGLLQCYKQERELRRKHRLSREIQCCHRRLLAVSRGPRFPSDLFCPHLSLRGKKRQALRSSLDSIQTILHQLQILSQVPGNVEPTPAFAGCNVPHQVHSVPERYDLTLMSHRWLQTVIAIMARHEVVETFA